MKKQRSPRISGISWGVVDVEEQGRFKDVKLWPGGARSWDWNETGTRHRPGVQPEDLEELLKNGSRQIIVGQGMLKQLQVPESTLTWLEERGVEVEVLQSKKAVDEYNRLAQNEPVGAVIHSTC